MVLAGRAEAFGVALRAVFVLDECGGWSSGIEGGFGIFVVAEAGESSVDEAGSVAGLCPSEALAFAIENELVVVDEGHAVSVCEALRALPHKVDMGRFLQDEARGVDGIAQAFDTGDAADFHAAAVHEERVELDAAVGGEEATSTGVEGGIVFEDGDGGFDSIDGSASAGEDFVADFEGVAHAGFVVGGSFGRDGPGSAMNEEGGIVCGGLGCHSDMVVHFAKRGRDRADRVNEKEGRWND